MARAFILADDHAFIGGYRRKLDRFIKEARLIPTPEYFKRTEKIGRYADEWYEISIECRAPGFRQVTDDYGYAPDGVQKAELKLIIDKRTMK